MLLCFLQELQTDIHGHRSAVQSLNATGSIIIQGSQTAGLPEGDKLQEQLKEMNDRWNRVNERSVELR
jgi:hypothetical protein